MIKSNDLVTTIISPLSLRLSAVRQVLSPHWRHSPSSCFVYQGCSRSPRGEEELLSPKVEIN